MPPFQFRRHFLLLLFSRLNFVRLAQAINTRMESPPETLQNAVDQLSTMGHRFHWMVADVDPGQGGQPPQCHALAGRGTKRPAPIASMCKLWVLGAVVDAIESGSISWDQLVPMREEEKSLPRSIVQEQPPWTVQELAELMISISDNTATDLLMKLVGRSAVERALVDYGHHDPALNMPFINTKELFILKLDPLGEQYIEANRRGRRSILADLEDTTLDSFGLDFSAWDNGPLAIDDVEWFGSPLDLCNVIGYKGGSEPGVLGLSWYLIPATTEDGVGHRVVTGMLWDQNNEIDEGKAYPLMAALRDNSLRPDFVPSATPTESPTSEPTAREPSSPPMPTSPTSVPTVKPARIPSATPTDSEYVTQHPTAAPTHAASATPTDHHLGPRPSESPTSAPTGARTSIPSATPTVVPTAAPTEGDTKPVATPSSEPEEVDTESESSSASALLSSMGPTMAFFMLFRALFQTL